MFRQCTVGWKTDVNRKEPVSESNGAFATVIMAVWCGDFDNGGLPHEISQGSTVQGNEYGLSLTAFPNAVARAEAHWYAVVGGHFQFRLADGGTCGMY
jgi:hypothetical protein